MKNRWPTNAHPKSGIYNITEVRLIVCHMFIIIPQRSPVMNQSQPVHLSVYINFVSNWFVTLLSEQCKHKHQFRHRFIDVNCKSFLPWKNVIMYFDTLINTSCQLNFCNLFYPFLFLTLSFSLLYVSTHFINYNKFNLDMMNKF